FPQLSDFSPEELIHLADDHDDQAFGLAFGNHPQMINEGDFFEIITGLKDPFANMAFGMEVRNAPSRVKSITKKLAYLDAPGYFWVGPHTKPDNLEEILVQNGWTYLAAPPAMLVDLNVLDASLVNPDIELREVITEEDQLIWQRAVSAGFNLSLEVAKIFAMPDGVRMKCYTAFLDGEPVGSTARVIHDGVAGIYCVSTLPDFRRRGVGATVTLLPLLDAREQGYQIGTLQASSMGLPIYEKLGFREVCRIKLYGYGVA
ncbi:MAG: GNAT family N-acetyltransferase, partial [Armatimonadota bacterium]